MKIKSILIVASIGMMFAACSSKDEYGVDINDRNIRVKANINAIATRAGVDPSQLQDESFYSATSPVYFNVYITKKSPKWQDVDIYSDSSGSYIKKEANEGLATAIPFIGPFNDGIYTPDGSDFAKVLFPESGGVDAIGVYPDTYDFSKTTFSVKTDQSSYANYRASDLMIATATSDAASGAISLNFEHKLAKLIVKLNTDNLSSDKLATTKILYGWDGDVFYYPFEVDVAYTGLNASKPGETFNVTLTPKDNETQTVIDMGYYNSEGNAAIVIPTTIPYGGNAFLQIIYDGVEYYCYSNNQIELEAGTETTVNVTLEYGKAYVSNVSISGWNNEKEPVDLNGSVLP